MSEATHDANAGFWQPPAPAAEPMPVRAAVEACGRCGIEFMVGARYCHTCGTPRIAAHGSRLPSAAWTWVKSTWSKVWSTVAAGEWLHHLQFHQIKSWVGLSTASLIAFIVGVGCVVYALGVGLVYTPQNFNDWQAIQYWRLELLLGAIAAFVAGILLKRSER